MNLSQNVWLDDFWVKFETRLLMTYISQSIDFVKFFSIKVCFSVTVGPTAMILGSCIHLSMTF